MKIHIGRAVMVITAVLAVALQIALLINAPRCDASSPKGPTLAHSFVIAGCR